MKINKLKNKLKMIIILKLQKLCFKILNFMN